MHARRAVPCRVVLVQKTRPHAAHQTGVGRTGKMWGYQNFDVEPDVITSAKVSDFFVIEETRQTTVF